MTQTELNYLLKKYRITPRRQSGQNFLINEQVSQKIIAAANLQPDEVVLEIGPGVGTITGALCVRAKRVVAVELDRRFMPLLNNLKVANKNLQLINSDIFKINLNSYFKDYQYKLVSNLPYNISSLVLRNFLECAPRPKLIVLLLQREVAERVCAKPGQMSLLSVAVQFFGQPEIIGNVEPDDFYPAPDVASAILRILVEPNGYSVEPKDFFKFVRAGYGSRRKTIINNLSNSYKIAKPEVEKWLIKQKIKIIARPQELSVKQWLELFDHYLQM